MVQQTAGSSVDSAWTPSPCEYLALSLLLPALMLRGACVLYLTPTVTNTGAEGGQGLHRVHGRRTQQEVPFLS